MVQHMLSFLTVSLVMSLIVVIVLGFSLLLPKIFSPRLRYVTWVIVLLGLVLPLRPMFGNGIFTISFPFGTQASDTQLQYPILGDLPSEPNTTIVDFEQLPSNYTQGLPIQPQIPQMQTPTNQFQTFLDALVMIWAIVALAILAYHIWKYIRFTRLLKRWSVPIDDENILSILTEIQNEKGLAKKKIALKRCGFISTSMLVGFLRPTILLPEKVFDADELALIFRHELIHHKRGDLYIKFLSVIAISLHWFNPLIYVMSSAMQADCEASCDEAVLSDIGGDNRQFYAELIMGMIGDKRSAATMLSTCFYGSKRGVKIRMDAIMNGASGVKKLAFSIIAMFMVLTVLSGSVFAFSIPTAFVEQPTFTMPPMSLPELQTEVQDGLVTAIQARDIALSQVGGGAFVGLYLDESLGIYRIEILQNSTRYYFAINIVSGDALLYRTEEIITHVISWTEAVETALALSGGGQMRSGEMEFRNGQPIFVFEIVRGSVEVNITLGSFGEVLIMEVSE